MSTAAYDLLFDALDARDARIAELEAALRPFAAYAKYMANRGWGHHDSSAYYGVKRPGAPQVRYGDFRRAAVVLK
jgi:hypothetical protein